MSLTITIFLISVAIAIYFAFKPSTTKSTAEPQIIDEKDVEVKVEATEVESPKKPKRKYYRRKPSSKKPKVTE